MSLVARITDPTPRQLTGFGLAWLLFFAVAGALVLRRGAPVPVGAVLLAAAVVVPLAGFLHRPFLRAVFLGATRLTHPIGVLVSTVLLAAVYFLVVTPIGLVRRALGHDPLGRGFDETKSSYWTPRPRRDDPERPFRQF